MARKVPASPAQAEVALDAVLARAPRPALPPGLAARIVAQATAQPQFAPELVAPTAQVVPFAPAAAVHKPAPPRNRRLIFGGGFAALAASLVAVVVIGQQTTPAPNLPKSAEIAVSPEVHQNAPKAHQTAPTPQLAAATPPSSTPARTEKTVVQIAPEAPQIDPAPVQIEAPQLATSGERPPRDVAGPNVDPSPAPRVVPNGGLMGPPAPQQGWAFTGGAPGNTTLPSGQSLPSQTTGTMPPPSSPGGHP